MSGTSTIRGVTLSFDRAGSGPTLVWGHGLTSSRQSEDEFPILDWSRVRSTVDVLRYDARGHGESGFTANSADYAWDRLALDQIGLMDDLGIERAVIGGASMGAATALHTALMAPDRVAGLVLVIPPTAWETRAGQSELYLQMADVVEAGDVEPLIVAGAELPQPDPFLGDDRWKQRRAEAMRSADPVRLAGVFRGAAVADFPPVEAVRDITCPTLILAWSGDPGHPVSTADRLGGLIADSTVSVASTATDVAGWTGQLIDFMGRHA